MTTHVCVCVIRPLTHNVLPYRRLTHHSPCVCDCGVVIVYRRVGHRVECAVETPSKAARRDGLTHLRIHTHRDSHRHTRGLVTLHSCTHIRRCVRLCVWYAVLTVQVLSCVCVCVCVRVYVCVSHNLSHLLHLTLHMYNRLLSQQMNRNGRIQSRHQPFRHLLSIFRCSCS